MSGPVRDDPFLGAVVVSTAGRDRRRVFIVTGTELRGTTVMLTVADGSLRRLAARKRKNPRHVKILGRLTDEEWETFISDPGDGTVRRLVGKYDPLITAEKRNGDRPECGEGEN